MRRRRLPPMAYFGYRGAGELLSRLPEPVADRAAKLVANAATIVPAGAGDMYVRHLRRVLGRDLSVREKREWTNRAFRMYARYWLEGARLPSVPPTVVEARMEVEGAWDEFKAHMASGKGVIMALPHVGSWEWGGAWLAIRGYPMTAVAEPIEPPELYDWFVEQRKGMGLTIVQLGPSAGTALMRTLRDGGLVGLLCDRDVAGGGIEVEFFGERTTLPGGPATLALRTGAALMPTAVYSGPGQNHTGCILPAIEATRTGSLREDVTRVTQAVARGLETLIRRAPDQWHLFQPNWPSDPGWSGSRT